MKSLTATQKLAITEIINAWYFHTRETDVFLKDNAIKVASNLSSTVAINVLSSGVFIPSTIKQIFAERDACLLRGVAVEKLFTTITQKAECLLNQGMNKEYLIESVKATERDFYYQNHHLLIANSRDKIKGLPLSHLLCQLLDNSVPIGIAVRQLGDSHANALLAMRSIPEKTSLFPAVHEFLMMGDVIADSARLNAEYMYQQSIKRANSQPDQIFYPQKIRLSYALPTS